VVAPWAGIVVGVVCAQAARGPDPAQLDALIERVRPVEAVVEVEQGDTVWLPITLKLRDAPPADLRVELRRREGTPGLSAFERVERVELELVRGQALGRARVVLRVEPDAPVGAGQVVARAEAGDALGRLFGDAALRWSVRVVPPRTPVAELQLLAAAFQRHQAVAVRAGRGLGPLESKLRFDRVEVPALPGLTRAEELSLTAFVGARLRADAAERRLRAAARVPDGVIARAALEALAGLAPPVPPPPAPRPSDVKPDARQARARADDALARFDRLELRGVDGALWRARMTTGLDREALAKVLVRLGALALLRGDLGGQELLLQGACLDPSALERLEPAALADLTRTAAARCTRPLALHSTSAVPVDTDDGPGVRVRVLVGPDPGHALDGAKLELLGPAEGVVAARDVVAERGDLTGFAAIFAARELPQTEGAPVRLRARLRARDVAGNTLLALDAVDATVSAEGEDLTSGLPWWLWVAGGALVAGAATSVILGVRGGGATPTIGPVDVRF
jgi:hypothetical protein